MKVLLITPNTRLNEDLKDVALLTPPLNLMYLAQALNDAGHKAEIIDCYALDLKDDELLKKVKRFEPEFFGFALYSNDLKLTYDLTRKIHDEYPNVPQMFGCHHAALMPVETMDEYPHVDYICRGEGERTIVELADCVEKGGDPAKVRGISYRKGKRIAHNRSRPVIDELDSISIPSRDLIDQKLYYSKMSKHNPTGVIITSRGCPYQCIYCSKLDGFQNYRQRSAENVVEELKEILAHGAKSIEFYDETFTINHKRCYKILDLLKEEGLDFEFRIRTRVNVVNRKLLSRMVERGCTVASYGIESGNQRILDSIKKGTTLPMIEKAFKLTHELGINTLAFNILGLPGDTPETIAETINFNLKVQPSFPIFVYPYPYPGTEIYFNAKRDNTLVGDWGVDEPIPWVKLPWLQSKQQLVDYVDLAFKTFYGDWGFRFKFLARCLKQRNWTILRYALENIQIDIKDINFVRTKDLKEDDE